jgi:hypothetical protein
MGSKPANMNPETGWAGTGTRGVDIYSALVVTTTSGTVDTTNSDSLAACRLSFVKTATKTGRYTFTFPDRYRKLVGCAVAVIGPTDAAIGANTKGLDWFLRNNNITTSTGGTIDVQFAQTSYADAELPDAASFIVTFWVARGI